MQDHTHLSKIQTSTQNGSARGVNSTPTVFVNGQLVRGAISLAKFESIAGTRSAEVVTLRLAAV